MVIDILSILSSLHHNGFLARDDKATAIGGGSIVKKLPPAWKFIGCKSEKEYEPTVRYFTFVKLPDPASIEGKSPRPDLICLSVASFIHKGSATLWSWDRLTMSYKAFYGDVLRIPLLLTAATQLKSGTFLLTTNCIMADLGVNRLFNVNDMVFVITGGGSGLGEMMALALDANGASKVFILGRREASLEAVASKAVCFRIVSSRTGSC